MTKYLPKQLPAVLLLGIVSQIGQVLILRELLMVYHGNELTIGIILASWMLWVGVGCRLGTTAVIRSRRPWLLLLFSTSLVLAVLPLTLILIRGLRGFFDILPGALLSLPDVMLSSFLIIAPLGLALGAQFIILARIWRENIGGGEPAGGAGNTYIWEAVGNLCGGILFTFVMVHYLTSIQTAVLAGGLMAAATLFLILKTQARPELRSLLPLLGLIAVIAAAWPWLAGLDFWAYQLQWRHFAPEYELIDIQQSKHGTISVAWREGQYSFFQSGHLVFSTAGPEAESPGFEEQQGANFAHLTMAQHREPRDILLIGGGWGGSLGEMIKHPLRQLDYVELDEKLTAAALPYLSQSTREALEDSRVRLLHTDGRGFVKNTRKKYDMIAVDIPDPATAVLNRYYTLEFFQAAKELLNPEGVLVVGATSAPDLRDRALANRKAAIYHTLDKVFSRVLAAGERTLYYYAADTEEQISIDPVILAERYRDRQIDSESFAAGHYQTLLRESQLRRINWVIRNHGRTADAHLEGPPSIPLTPGSVAEQEAEKSELPPVQMRYFINSDFRPIGYYYTLMYWEKTGRGRTGETFSNLLAVNYPKWGVLALALCFIPAFGFKYVARSRGSRLDIKFAVLLAVFTTGLSTMIMQIALLFSFQSVYGFVYEMVGLIVAMFMGGLAAGTFCAQRLIKDKTNIHTLAMVQLTLAVFAVMLGILIPVVARMETMPLIFTVFTGLTFTAGFLNGLDFPLVTSNLIKTNRSADKSAGAVYSLELIGACTGSILASAVLAPIFGILICCLVAAVGNGAAFAVLLIVGSGKRR